jgi:Kef-type K+ transport system membrane component KefB
LRPFFAAAGLVANDVRLFAEMEIVLGALLGGPLMGASMISYNLFALKRWFLALLLPIPSYLVSVQILQEAGRWNDRITDEILGLGILVSVGSVVIAFLAWRLLGGKAGLQHSSLSGPRVPPAVLPPLLALAALVWQGLFWGWCPAPHCDNLSPAKTVRVGARKTLALPASDRMLRLAGPVPKQRRRPPLWASR